MPRALSVEFPAETYAQFRPVYPNALYEHLRMQAEAAQVRWPCPIADIGCGSGQSTVGLARSGLASRIYAIEPAAAMLEQARQRTELRQAKIEFVERVGEETGLEDRSVGIVFCASAFHWMNQQRAVQEFMRILSRPGLLFFAEYRFPRSERHPEFDRWIKERLTGEWQSPELRVRASFSDLVSIFAQEPGVSPLGLQPVTMRLELGWLDLLGLIHSQSRYVRYLSELGSREKREAFEKEVAEKVRSLLGEEKDMYDFRLQAAAFAAS